MNSRLGSVLLSLLMSASVMAGEYNLTVDRVEIDTGDFVKDGIGYNGASPGPVKPSPTNFPSSRLVLIGFTATPVFRSRMAPTVPSLSNLRDVNRSATIANT